MSFILPGDIVWLVEYALAAPLSRRAKAAESGYNGATVLHTCVFWRAAFEFRLSSTLKIRRQRSWRCETAVWVRDSRSAFQSISVGMRWRGLLVSTVFLRLPLFTKERHLPVCDPGEWAPAGQYFARSAKRETCFKVHALSVARVLRRSHRQGACMLPPPKRGGPMQVAASRRSAPHFAEDDRPSSGSDGRPATATPRLSSARSVAVKKDRRTEEEVMYGEQLDTPQRHAENLHSLNHIGQTNHADMRRARILEEGGASDGTFFAVRRRQAAPGRGSRLADVVGAVPAVDRYACVSCQARNGVWKVLTCLIVVAMLVRTRGYYVVGPADNSYCVNWRSTAAERPPVSTRPCLRQSARSWRRLGRPNLRWWDISCCPWPCTMCIES